jgi:thiamine biosynthesis protein ThiI
MLRKAKIPFYKYQMSKDTARIFFFFNNSDIKNAMDILQKVFGIHSFSPALRTSNKIKHIAKKAIQVAERVLKRGDCFALRVKRSGTHNFTSQDVAIQVGQAIMDHFDHLNLTVDLESPDKRIFIEVRNQFSYIFTEIIENRWKGLPIEYNKKLIVMDNGRISDLLAGFFLMRRGCVIYPILFNISDNSKNKSKWLTNWKELVSYTPFSQFTLIKINFTKILDLVRTLLTKKSYLCAMCRLLRFEIISMVLNIQEIPKIKNSQAITDGLNFNDIDICFDDVDLNSIALTNDFVRQPFFTPLAGFDSDEIGDLLKGLSTNLQDFSYCKYQPKRQKCDLNEIQEIYSSLKPRIKNFLDVIVNNYEKIIIK